MNRNIYRGLIILVITLFFSGCGQPAIIENAKIGNLQKVKEEIENGIDINIINDNGYTALILAASYGKLEVVKYLIEKGANIESTDKNGGTPLYYSFDGSNLKIIKYLVEKGANLNVKSNSGWSPLHRVASTGTVEIAKYLVSKGANIEVKTKTGNTPLTLAYRFRKYNIAKYLVEEGANINHMNNHGDTALHWAVHYGNLESVKSLLKKGAKSNIINNDGQSALMSAKVLRLSKIVQYLEYGYKEDILAQKKEENKKQIEQKQKEVNEYIIRKDLEGLKVYTDTNPNAVYYIKDDSLRLALTGPKDMKVGDIRKLLKDGRDKGIVISLIKRVKKPYKEFTLDEIDLLAKMELPSQVISAMIDRTTYLLENEENRKQQEFFLAEQKRIKDEKVKVVQTRNLNQKVDAQGNLIAEKVQDELIKQGVGMLLDHFF